ncbi:MAG: NusA N-terminal domain-containing protein, partial [Bacilli bacterium]
MNSDEFLKAVKILEEEKHIDRETIFDAMELALTSAYKKHYGKPNCKVVINKETGEIKVYSYKTVVEDIYAEDDEEEELDENGEVIVKNKPKYNVAPEEIKISLEDARKIDKRYELGDTVDTEVTPHDFGRVAASTAKQVVIQKIREAERESLISEFKDKEGELVQGVAELEDEGNYYINLGRTNGILSKKELIGDEKIEMGSSVKAYVSKVDSNNKGTIILLTRRHPNFVKRLFELEIPELADGSVVIYGVARD